MRVMIDTNVLISALVFPNPRMTKLIHKLIDDHEIVLRSHILDELHRVFEEKFPLKRNALEQFLIRFPYELFYTPRSINAVSFPHIRDKHDLPILVSAIMADVDIILTGDNDFSKLDIDRPEILKPAEFLVKY